MALSLVQDYLNTALSLTIGNKSGTNVNYRLPDDLRRLNDLKVKSYNARTFVVPASETAQTIGRSIATESTTVIIFSHPVLVTAVNGSNVTNFNTSLFVASRDRSGTASYAATILTYSNTLAAPNYTAVDLALDTDVTVFVIGIELEA
tara:strand:+ start:252 stop:695 length:444 start_codon:yes stop_codon:yes gene_type:complete